MNEQLSGAWTRRRMLRAAAGTAGTAAAGTVLAACGAAQGTGGTASAGAAHLSAAPVKLSYTFWSTESNRQMQERNVQLFNQQHPNITFDILHNPDNFYDKLQTMFAGGTPPDIFDMASDQFPGWVQRDTMLDLTPLIKRDQGKELDMKDIWPRTIKAYEWQNKQYGIPRSTSVYAIYYNVEQFERAGIPLPTDNWTWDTLLDAAKRLAKPESGQWGYWFHAWQHWLWSAGGDIMTQEKGGKWRSHLADAASVEAFQFLADMTYKHKVQPASKQDTGGLNDMNTFMAGKLAMLDEVVARTADFRQKQLSFRWDVAPLPKHRSGGRVTFERPACRAVAAPSKYHEEAWAFVKFVTGNKESQEQEARTAQWIVPSIRVSNSPVFLDPNQPPKNMKVFLDALSYARVNPVHARWDEINTMLGQELAPLWGGSKAAREAMTTADQRLTGMLKAWGDLA
jgi:multiple sugar transport system substrate-binding protein